MRARWRSLPRGGDEPLDVIHLSAAQRPRRERDGGRSKRRRPKSLIVEDKLVVEYPIRKDDVRFAHRSARAREVSFCDFSLEAVYWELTAYARANPSREANDFRGICRLHASLSGHGFLHGRPYDRQ